jgi:hypothetical protein
MIPVAIAVCATDATTLPEEMTLTSATARSNERDDAPGWGNLTLGSERYCVRFGGDEGRNDETLLKRKNAPGGAVCP